MDYRLLERLMTDKEYYFEHILQVEDKNRNIVPFRLKPIQRDMLHSMTGRDVYLKPAQVGSTTLFIASFLHDCLYKPGTVSVVVAHEEFITQRLFAKAKYFESIIPKELKHEMEHKSAYEMTWPDVHSTFYIGTARGYVFGRGDTIHNLLCSEYAFWPNMMRIIGPALDRVPLEGNLIVESTPNGEDNEFYDLYTNAKEYSEYGMNRFTHHFYPWTMEPDYQLPPDSPYALQVDKVSPLEYTEEELELTRILGATENQIRWRRMKLAEKEQMSRSGEYTLLFAQEFPTNDVSCFLTSGDSVYDGELLMDYAKRCYKAPYSFDSFKVWHKPEENHKYMVCVDPGMGINTRTGITVWKFYMDGDNEHGQHCATYAGLLPPEPTADKVIAISRYYNNAIVVPEANNHGLALLAALHGKNFRNIYLRRDIVSGITTMQEGWLTTPRTKPFMVTELARMLPKLEIYDIDLISEIKSMRAVGEKIMSTSFDDLHDTAAIAAVCRQSRPTLRGYIGSAGYKGGRWN